MMQGSILLDTCAVLWIGLAEPMAVTAMEALDEAYASSLPTVISPITAWEIGLLASRGRLALPTTPMAFFSRIRHAPGISTSALSEEVLLQSSYLPGSPPTDPADRIIISTARDLGLRIMTRDHRILNYAEAGHVMAIPC